MQNATDKRYVYPCTWERDEGESRGEALTEVDGGSSGSPYMFNQRSGLGSQYLRLCDCRVRSGCSLLVILGFRW